jgi:hypothetical protein
MNIVEPFRSGLLASLRPDVQCSTSARSDIRSETWGQVCSA